MSLLLRVEHAPGPTIDEFARELVAFADRVGVGVVCNVNGMGFDMWALPGMKADNVVAHWRRALETRERSAQPTAGGEKAQSFVPRPHCNRCDRCGWEFAQNCGCTPNSCSQRPMPEKRDRCAGCGARFQNSEAS